MTTHVHRWNDERDCDAVLLVGGRAIACAARKCRVPECRERNVPPLDYCAQHRHFAKRLVLPSKGANA